MQQQRFVVGPHRGMVGSGLWSVKRDGEMVGIHRSLLDAVAHAMTRAKNEWALHGIVSGVFVQEEDGRLREEHTFGQRPQAQEA